MTHDELAVDLAGHVRGPRTMVWTDLQLGPSGSVRPDVYALEKSFVHPNPRAWEVKVSHSDFRADVTTGKWMAYLKHAGSVTFACEDGLLRPAEVPDVCGLVVRTATGWRARKRATPSPVEIPPKTWLKLLIDGVEREGPILRRRRWRDSEDGFFRKYGAAAAAHVADAAHTDRTIRNAEYQAEAILDRARNEAERIRKAREEECAPLWRRLTESLALPADAHVYAVQDAIRRVEAARSGTPERRLLEQLRGEAQRRAEAISRVLDPVVEEAP